MRIPETKIDRFIQNDIQTLYFRRGEIIFREGDTNSFLFIISSGEANLLQNFQKCEYSFMQNNQYSMEYIKNMAKRIDYKGVMNNAFNNNNNNQSLNFKINNRTSVSIDISEEENLNNRISTSTSANINNINLINEKFNQNVNNQNFRNSIKVDKKDVPDKSTIDSQKLDLLLEKSNYKNILSLSKGSIGGLEICTGITKFKYSLISNSDFTSCFKIDLRKLDAEHLTELMVNLLPLFIEYERKIHYQIKKLKFIDSNLYPEACQKYRRKR